MGECPMDCSRGSAKCLRCQLCKQVAGGCTFDVLNVDYCLMNVMIA